MPLQPLNQPLTDLGGVPVVWDSDTGTLVQDPTQGGTNSYGPGDLFRDPNTGDLYQLQTDGSLSLYKVAVSAPTVNSPLVSSISSAGQSFSSSPRPVAGGTPAISATGDPTKFGHQVVTWLSKASFIGGLPNGVLVMGGAIAYMFVKQRRRRNPYRRNPGKMARMGRRAEAGRRRREQLYVGPYIREQRAAIGRGLDGRAGRLEQTYYLAQRRRRRR